MNLLPNSNPLGQSFAGCSHLSQLQGLLDFSDQSAGLLFTCLHSMFVKWFAAQALILHV
jgi:hypothetical protein